MGGLSDALKVVCRMTHALPRICAPWGEDSPVVVFFEPVSNFPIGKLLERLRLGRWTAVKADKRNLRFDDRHVTDRIFAFPEMIHAQNRVATAVPVSRHAPEMPGRCAFMMNRRPVDSLGIGCGVERRFAEIQDEHPVVMIVEAVEMNSHGSR